MKKILLVLSVLLIFTSCETLKVSVKEGGEDLSNLSSMGVTTIKFKERTFPIFPLIDAGVYRSAAKSNSEMFEISNNEIAQKCMNAVVTQFEDKKGIDVTELEIEYPTISDSDENIDIDKLKEIMEDNNLESILVMDFQVRTVNISAYGLNGNTLYDIDCTIYNANGEIIKEGNITSQTKNLGAKNVKAYEQLLRTSPGLLTNLIGLM